MAERATAEIVRGTMRPLSRGGVLDPDLPSQGMFPGGSDVFKVGTQRLMYHERFQLKRIASINRGIFGSRTSDGRQFRHWAQQDYRGTRPLLRFPSIPSAGRVILLSHNLIEGCGSSTPCPNCQAERSHQEAKISLKDVIV